MSQTISEMLAVQADRFSSHPAILTPDGFSMTYAELGATVDRLRRRLHTLGVGRDNRIAVVFPNGSGMAVAFLACASTAACAPLNPAYRQSEFEYYFADLGVKALLTSRGASANAVLAAQARDIPVFLLDTSFSIEGRRTAEAASGGPPVPEDTALVLHTSGTTSRPKQVPLTHGNLCASASSIVKTLGLTPQDRCMNVMPLFHIHGITAALLASLSAGASIVCTNGFDGLKFHAQLAAIRPTWYTAVPTMHQLTVDRAIRRVPLPVPGLRFVRSSSAPLPPRLMHEIENLFGVPMIEAYGMTEAAHQMASNPLPPGIRKPGSVGPPTGCEVAILAEDGSYAGVETRGEVLIRGAGVMHGYHANSEANAVSFKDGWFRTGDQGFFDAAGYLTLTGRLKEIINRGGEKISPREVDEVLLNFPGVREAVTFGMAHRTLGEEVAAAVVMREGSPSEKEMRDFAGRSLASFKVPRRIVFLSEVPKGPTGKIQRIGLAERLGLDPL